jgi:hypothetical protein
VSEDSPHPVAGDEAAGRYELMLDSGRRLVVWRFEGNAITLDEAGLSFALRGIDQRRAWTDVRAVQLTLSHGGRNSGPVGVCEITFRDGLVLRVRSCDRHGFGDDERAQTYYQFLQALHARLAAAGAKGVHFGGGSTRTRQRVLKGLLVVMALMFIGLPAGAFLWTLDIETLGMTVAGGAFTVPFYMLMRRNEPRSYVPDSLPQDLLP